MHIHPHTFEFSFVVPSSHLALRRHVSSFFSRCSPIEETIDKFADHGPLKSVDYQWGIEEAKIRLALDDVYSQNGNCLKYLSGVITPVKLRALTVTRSFEAEELVLVPLSSAIYLKKQTDIVQCGHVFMKTYKDPKGLTFNIVLAPSGGIKMPKAETNTGVGGLKQAPSSLVIPFWLVQDSGEHGTPNMKLKTVKSTAVPSVHVPILTNKCAINKGDVLSAQLASLMPKRKVDDVPAAPAAKKARKR